LLSPASGRRIARITAAALLADINMELDVPVAAQRYGFDGGSRRCFEFIGAPALQFTL
jgi:hypothetical protein